MKRVEKKDLALHEHFAAEVARACAAVKKQGPLPASERARVAAKERPKRVPWTQMLVAAVKSLDVEAAREALLHGASALASAGKGENLFTAWEMACRAAPKEDRRASEMLALLEENGLPLTTAGSEGAIPAMGSEAKKNGGADLRAWRLICAESWIGHWSSRALSEQAALLGALAGWGRSDDAASRAGPRDLLKKMLGTMAADGDWMDMGLVGALGDKFGVELSALEWRCFGKLLSDEFWYGDAEDLVWALSRGKEKIDEKTSGLILAYAIDCDNIDLMGAIAKRARSLDWMLPGEVWSQVDKEPSQRLCWVDGKPRGLSALHFALWRNRREEFEGEVIGRECFRALGQIEQAVFGALDNPLPAALAGCSVEELLELEERWPALLGSPEWNVGHEKALSVSNEATATERIAEFKKMLGTPLAKYLQSRSEQGEMALGILTKSLEPGADAVKWRKFLAKWEKEQMASGMKRAHAAGRKAARARRL